MLRKDLPVTVRKEMGGRRRERRRNTLRHFCLFVFLVSFFSFFFFFGSGYPEKEIYMKESVN